jgi:hypothetical protein
LRIEKVEANVILNLPIHLATVAAAWLMAFPTLAQEGRWAAPGDETAKHLVAWERQWAEEACTHNGITKTILADDFQGTAPDGRRYTKSEEVEGSQPSKVRARDCRLIDAKVRFFNDNVALVYGSESSIRKSRNGKEYKRCLVWTDTWLKRNGTWQIVAAQDTEVACK